MKLAQYFLLVLLLARGYDKTQETLKPRVENQNDKAVACNKATGLYAKMYHLEIGLLITFWNDTLDRFD